MKDSSKEFADLYYDTMVDFEDISVKISHFIRNVACSKDISKASQKVLIDYANGIRDYIKSATTKLCQIGKVSGK